MNQSVLELSDDELIKECSRLKKTSASNQSQITNKNQELALAQREISRLTLLQQDHITELDILESNREKAANKLEEQHQSLEEEHEAINKLHKVQYDELDVEYSEEIAKLEKLEEDVKVATEEYELQEAVDNTHLFEINFALKQQAEALELQLMNLQAEMETCIRKKQQLNEKLKVSTEETEVYREKCNYNKDTLEEAKSLLEMLEGDLAMLKIEHQGLRGGCDAGPSGPNSLFNEVDERRNQLQDQFSRIKDTYVEKKNEKNSLNRKLRVLEMENVQLNYSWKDDRSAKDMDALEIQNSYKNAITAHEDVSNVLDDLIKERNVGDLVITPKETQLFFDVNSKFDNKIRESDKRLLEENYTNFNLNYNLTKCQKNIDMVKEKIPKIEEKINVLKAELEAAEQIELGGDSICVCKLKTRKETITKKANESKENQAP